MSSLHFLREDVAVVGWSCRVPGASSVDELWPLLIDGRCSVGTIPADRWSLTQYGHLRRKERGKSYTWAAGVLDDVWGFDPALFGISPREAEQMDPQQRQLLELTWEALEDAGIRPSAIAGSDVGVFIGGSSTDYANARWGDPAGLDSHFATGNALSILANRISYVFDLRGPSITVDTACSSSLVALHQAMEALRAGRIDTAIVGGINVLASPFSFISFSQAAMLSPTGLCQAFSANADGYVRAEGGAVIVLRKASLARTDRNPIHGIIVATDVNSDGRTHGISLPSGDAQEKLLERVYAQGDIDPDRLAFIEAHGTGTAVGDPTEAIAVGNALGRKRSEPLTIGSIKTNIGHLEPASGLAGLLKAMLALNHGVLPRSLHCEEANPRIDFERLNLAVCTKPLPLPKAAEQLAGVSSFGFGGTNAHVVIAPGRPVAAAPASNQANGTGFFTMSAESHPALVSLAQKYSERLSDASDDEAKVVARVAAHRRDRLSNRLVVSAPRRAEVVEALDAFIAGEEDPRLITGQALGNALPVAFVYSGNGSQWVGMGIAAYRDDEEFCAHFDQIDEIYRVVGGWSLREVLHSESLAEKLRLTSVAQPLIFAIQSATTAALRRRGLRPSMVLGHSVGEVAAAEAAGVLDLRSAVRVIHSRSTHQELVRGAGRMAAVLSPPDAVNQLLAQVKDLSLAAINSPRAVTLAGPTEAITALRAAARRQRLVFRDLDLEYPFHTPAMAPVEEHLIADLHDLAPHDGDVKFISTVTGDCLPGTRMNAHYWWQNVREPVQFDAALKQAAKLGARVFVEIGPRSTLLTHISDSIESEGVHFAAFSVLDRNDQNGDPFDKAVANCIIRGAQLDNDAVFGPDPGTVAALPTYPWQHSEFRNTLTPEAVGYLHDRDRHPLCGSRLNADGLEWRAHLDTMTMPELADHKIGEQVILPGAAYLEMAVAVAQHWLHAENVSIADFEFLKPLDLSGGETREILSRVSPGSNTLEIMSRPRLSGAAWLLHARAKMFHGSHGGVVDERPASATNGVRVRGDTVYRNASTSGLNYGPAFRLVEDVVRSGTMTIDVTLAPVPQTDAEPAFHLDPARLDACFHGLFVLFPELQAEARGVAYIPVRFDELNYLAVGAMPQRATIELRSASERAVVADFTIYGANGETIAILRGAHFQAVVTRRTAGLDSIALVEQLRLLDGRALRRTGVDISATNFIAKAQTLKPDDAKPAQQGDESFILEGWAMAMAYEIATGLSRGEEFNPETLVAGGHLPPEMLPWLRNILFSLEGAGLAKEAHGRWSLVEDTLPSSASVLQALAGGHPARSAELFLAGELTGLSARLASDGKLSAPAALSNDALDFYAIAGTWAANASELLTRLLHKTDTMWPEDRSLRVLQIGFGPLTQTLADMVQSHNVHLTVLEPERRRHERAKLALPNSSGVTLIELQSNAPLGEFDVIISVESLHRLPSSLRLGKLRPSLAPRGLLIGIEPQPSLFRDLVFGLSRGWFERGVGGFPAGSLLTAGEWKQALEDAGFANANTTSVSLGSEAALVVVAEAPAQLAKTVDATVRPGTDGISTLIVADAASPQREIATTLAALLPGSGVHVAMVLDESGAAKFPDLMSDVVVQFLPLTNDEAGPMEQLSSRCLEIKSCAERIGAARATLWIVFAGALIAASAKIDPVEAGAWAFSRTLANEFPNLDIRRIDLAAHVSKKAAAERIRDLILSGTDETEIQIGSNGIRAVRVESIKQSLDSDADDFAPAAKLQRRMMSNQRLHWQAMERTLPQADEVEIAVEATGLNFRDLMWMLALLPEDMLEHGFTGPTLGLECAGRIVKVGANVKHLKNGDHVVALSPSAFSTHVVIPALMAAKVPDGLTSEDAATIPVAFLTAYYSLLRLAKLKRGEWILIHGGAGAVGMAAIQIAHWRGAQVIATAGSKAKRDLLRALGVAHVLDSRSTDFVDEVREITGVGVDVVLNSLAGEAMERGLSTLRPFGRFVELGKRDYVANTHIGLRPFRRNLSYFGVDLDNLIEAKRGLGHRIYKDMMRLFRDGVLTPLPHSVFPAAEVADAFHLMQESGHIGKIVVRPPKPGTVRRPHQPFTVDGQRTHLITGGFGGFGLETAKWLVDRGARHLVLLGRKGAASDEARVVIADLAKRGVKVMAEAGDVGDRRFVEKLFEKIHTRMPPVAGVIHAAMVLEDALITNLDADQLDRVLRPKVKGAVNLDIATRGLSLDYFVLFSSVTTLIGNPGQGSYVAANGFMEGLARRRRQEGLPALAIGWGPISNVGVVAQSKKLQRSLQARSGVRGLIARDALDLMAEALEQSGDTAQLGTITIASNEWTLAGDRLRVLRSPTYAAVVRDDASHGDSTVTTLDLRALVAAENLETVRRKVADRIVTELARVLHSREEDISRVRPLAEIGVDSLMALELGMNLKESFGVEVPLSNSASSMTVAGLAEELIAQVNLDASRGEDTVAYAVAERHIAGKIDPEQVEALKYAQRSDGQKTRRLLS